MFKPEEREVQIWELRLVFSFFLKPVPYRVFFEFECISTLQAGVEGGNEHFFSVHYVLGYRLQSLLVAEQRSLPRSF